MENVLGKRIKNLLEEKNLTQKELAEIIDTTEATISRNINGVHAPKAEIIEKIASALGVTTDYLLGKTDDRTNIKLALYNQLGELTEDQAKDALKYIEFIKSKK